MWRDNYYSDDYYKTKKSNNYDTVLSHSSNNRYINKHGRVLKDIDDFNYNTDNSFYYNFEKKYRSTKNSKDSAYEAKKNRRAKRTKILLPVFSALSLLIPIAITIFILTNFIILGRTIGGLTIFFSIIVFVYCVVVFFILLIKRRGIMQKYKKGIARCIVLVLVAFLSVSGFYFHLNRTVRYSFSFEDFYNRSGEHIHTFQFNPDARELISNKNEQGYVFIDFNIRWSIRRGSWNQTGFRNRTITFQAADFSQSVIISINHTHQSVSVEFLNVPIDLVVSSFTLHFSDDVNVINPVITLTFRN